MDTYQEQDIAVLDASGNITGSKKRKDVDRRTDFLYSVYVTLFNSEGKMVMQRLPQKEPRLKLYGGKIGNAVGALVQLGESRDVCARNALARELYLADAVPVFVDEQFQVFADNVGRRLAVYYLQVPEKELKFSPEKIGELLYLTLTELEALLTSEPEAFTPSFVWIWERYHDRFPF